MLRYGWVAVPGVVLAAAGCGGHEEPLALQRQSVSGVCSSATSTSNFVVQTFERQGGQFEVSFQATPSAAPSDALVGLSLGSAQNYSDLAAIVRFNSDGFIDARNGSTYEALNSIAYGAGVPRNFSLTIDLISRRYSVYVDNQLLARDFAFRSEQSSSLFLDGLVTKVDEGDALSVCDVSVRTTLACDSALPGQGFLNQSYPPTSPAFTATFIAVPRAANMDGVMGISTDAASAFPDLAGAVRFNPAGQIDALSGSAYTSTAGQADYAPNQMYPFTIVADAVDHTYSVIRPGWDQVTPHLAFRPSQSGAPALGNFAAISDSDAGALTICKQPGSGGVQGAAWIHETGKYGAGTYALAVSNDRLLLSDTEHTQVLDAAGAVTRTIPYGGTSVTDSQGNLYLLGKFDGSYDGGTGVVYPTAGGGNVYVSKYSPDFEPIYTVALGATPQATVSSPSADAHGELAFVLNDNGSTAALKLDPSGAIAWSSNESVNAVALDASGDMVLGNSSASSLTVSRRDPTGNLLWARSFASSGVALEGVLFDSLGNAGFWGRIQGQIQFGDTSLRANAGENGPIALLGTLSPNGAPRYVRVADVQSVKRVLADGSGNLLLIGTHVNAWAWRLDRFDQNGQLTVERSGEDLLPELFVGMSGDAAIDC